MSFQLRNSADDKVVFENKFTPSDFGAFGYHTEHFEMAFPGGETKSTQWLFDGIRMSYSESVFKEYTELDWKGSAEMITMHFNLQGSISVQDRDTQRPFNFSTNQHNIFYGKEAEGKLRMEELMTKLFIVQLSRESFFRIAENGNDAIRRFADAVASQRSAAFSDHNLDIDLPILHCIQAVLECPYAESLKRMFLLSKSIELLVLQAESFNRALEGGVRTLKTDYDRERVLFARDYLIRNMESPPTLTELSRIAGINEFKLKRGFKETFNMTVFQYLSEARLEAAKHSLLESRKPVTEIAFELGYSSVQHFSAAFSKKFGMAPSQVKR